MAEETTFKFGGAVESSPSDEDAGPESSKNAHLVDDTSFLKTHSLPVPGAATQKKNGLGFSFQDLNADFIVPEQFKKIKKLGTGAYGKVMEVLHVETQQRFAVKRFEEVFSKELRAKRLLRELSILKNVKHPCLNKLKCVIPPTDYSNFNDAYLVLDLCDMDMKKLLKSSKHLEEIQVKSIIYDMLTGLLYLHKA